MTKSLLCVLGITIAAFGVSVLGQGTSDGINNIPSHLLECYRNNTLYRRENRLPATMTTLIELIRQIENYPGFNMDIRGLALSLFHMFRVDGIVNDPEIQASAEVTPFRLTGNQFHKYRILRQNLVTASPYIFQNQSLSSAQKCALHFMLSNSIDSIQRGDESQTCNIVNRARRETTEDEVHNAEEPSNSDLPLSPTNSSTGQSVQAPPAVSQDEEKTETEVKKNVNGPVEIFKKVDTNSSKKGDMMWNQDGGADNVPSARQTVQILTSDCPVENGVVYTRWGSVTAGNVLAGIATGLAPETVLIENIKNDGKTYNGLSVDNQWAATLAGDLAEVALFQGPYTGVNNLVVGTAGNWNSTQIPRWYFISSSRNDMTDAEIRGGIDGLIMAKYIAQWNTQTNGNMRLSQLLERFYSERGVLETKYRSCSRQDLYAEITPTETMQQQAYNFALTMSQSTASIPHINETGVKSFVDAAILKLNSYVPTQVASTCVQSRTTSGTTSVRAETDLYVVIDCSLQFADIRNMLWIIASEINLAMTGSKMTVVSGKSFDLLLNASTSANDIFANITQDIYSKCQANLDIKNLLEVNLKQLFNNQLDREMNTSGYVTSHSKIVLFVPNTFSATEEEFNAAKEAVRDFRDNRPDVKFLYLVSGTSEKLQELVEEQDKDIILTSNILKLVERIQEVHRRITNPVCGSSWTERSYSTAQITEYVKHQGINYYRIHPKYLFGVGSGSVKIQGSGAGELKVCQSRQFERPDNSTSINGNTNNEIQCKQISSDTYEISLSEPCGGHEYVLQCPPLYISVSSVGSSAYNCNDQTQCRDFADIKFTVTHTGLKCGVGRFLANSSILTLAAVLVTTFKMVVFSS